MSTSEPKSHSEFAPSGSKRWLNCSASIGLSKLAPPLPEMAAGTYGTNTHTCMEAFLRKPTHPYTVRSFLRKRYPDDMIEMAHQSSRLIQSIIAEYPGAEVLIEEKVDTSHLCEPGNFGSVDCAIIELFGTLTVIDLKTGVMPVDPVENEQLMMYALGIAKAQCYLFDKVRIVIVSPRARDSLGIKREWTTSMKSLMEWEKVYQKAAHDARHSPKVVPGSHCFFCPSRTHNCPAHLERKEERNKDMFEFDEDPERENTKEPQGSVKQRKK